MTRRHTRSEIAAILDRRDREGLTYEELAERTGVAKSTLSWWSWRRRREGGQRKRSERIRGFAEVVTVSEQPTRATTIELTTPSAGTAAAGQPGDLPWGVCAGGFVPVGGGAGAAGGE